jgi:hypothetical protein
MENQDALEKRYGANYLVLANKDYVFDGKNGRIISSEAAQTMYMIIADLIDKTKLPVDKALNLILHNEMQAMRGENPAAIAEWNIAIEKKDRYAISTNFALVMSYADVGNISMTVGQVDTYKPELVLRTAVADAKNLLGNFKDAAAMVKSISLNISKMGYSNSVANSYLRDNVVAEQLFKDWRSNKKKGDDTVTVQRLLDASILYRVQTRCDGFLYRKGFSKYWFAGFGFVFLADTEVYYSILGSSMRNSYMSVNRKEKGITVLSLFQSALRQRVAVSGNKQNIIGYDSQSESLIQSKNGKADVNVVPLSLTSFKDFFELDKVSAKYFMDGYCFFGNLDKDEKAIIKMLDGKKLKKRSSAGEEFEE